MTDRNPVFTAEELGYALIIASQTDPNIVNTDAAKALIYKARSLVERGPDNTFVIGPYSVRGN